MKLDHSASSVCLIPILRSLSRSHALFQNFMEVFFMVYDFFSYSSHFDGFFFLLSSSLQHFIYIPTVRNVKRMRFFQWGMKTVAGRNRIMIVAVPTSGCWHTLCRSSDMKMDHTFSSKFRHKTYCQCKSQFHR